MNRCWQAVLLAIAGAELVYLNRTLGDIKQENRQLTERVDHLETEVGRIVSTAERISFTARDLDCLTANVYWESLVEDDVGRLAVATVTINRVKSGRWGHDVCGVVYARRQFSWTWGKRQPKQRPNLSAWQHCRGLALAVLNGTRVQGVQNSQFYHADYIAQPGWARDQYRTAQLGHHVFYSQAN